MPYLSQKMNIAGAVTREILRIVADPAMCISEGCAYKVAILGGYKFDYDNYKHPEAWRLLEEVCADPGRDWAVMVALVREGCVR